MITFQSLLSRSPKTPNCPIDADRAKAASSVFLVEVDETLSSLEKKRAIGNEPTDTSDPLLSLNSELASSLKHQTTNNSDQGRSDSKFNNFSLKHSDTLELEPDSYSFEQDSSIFIFLTEEEDILTDSSFYYNMLTAGEEDPSNQLNTGIAGMQLRESRSLPPIPIDNDHASQNPWTANPETQSEVSITYTGPMTAPATFKQHEDLLVLSPPVNLPSSPLMPLKDSMERTHSNQSHLSSYSASASPTLPVPPLNHTETFISPNINNPFQQDQTRVIVQPPSSMSPPSPVYVSTAQRPDDQNNTSTAEHIRPPHIPSHQQQSPSTIGGMNNRPPVGRPMQVPIGPDGRPMSMMMVNGRPAFVMMSPGGRPSMQSQGLPSNNRPFMPGSQGRPVMIVPQPGARPVFMNPQQQRPQNGGPIPVMMRPINGALRPMTLRPPQPGQPMMVPVGTRPGQPMFIGPQGRPMILVTSGPSAANGYPAAVQPFNRPLNSAPTGIPPPALRPRGSNIPPQVMPIRPQTTQFIGTAVNMNHLSQQAQPNPSNPGSLGNMNRPPSASAPPGPAFPSHMRPFNPVSISTASIALTNESVQRDNSASPSPSQRNSFDSSASPYPDGGSDDVNLEDVLKEAPAVPPSPQLRPTFVTIRRKQTIKQQSLESAIVSPEVAQDERVNQTKSAVEKVPFEKTIALYRQNALRSSDPAIQFEFAKFCIENSEEHVEEGFVVLKRVAATGYADAQLYLGEAYRDDGRFDLAYAQFLHAAKKSHPGSCHALGQLAEEGKGCRKNRRLALEMYTKAATAGHVPSMVRLGRAERDGDLGLKPDINKAVKWFKRGAAVANREHPEPLYELADIYSKGYGSIGADENYARSVLKEACSFEYPPALVKMGYCYEHGQLGCPVSAMESIRLYRLAASKNDPEGLLALAGWYMTGASTYLKKDEPHAFQLAKRAADQDHARALYTVGYFFESGIGIQMDKVKAIEYYIKAAENGEARALETLEKMKSPSASQAIAKIKAQQKREKKAKSSFFGFFGN